MNGSIELVAGTLGAGKTYFGVEEGYRHVRAGGWFATNVEVYPEKFRERLALDGLRFDPQRIMQLEGDPREYHKQVPRGTAERLVMLLVDEAGLSQNSRDWAKTGKEELSFNTLARKLNIRLVYVTQDPNDIDKQFRRKAGKIWICRNFRHFKILGVLPMPLPFMARICMDNTQSRPRREHWEIVTRKQWVCDLYNTDALIGEAAQQFRGMVEVSGTPLERLRPEERPRKKSRLPYLTASLCAAFFYSYFQQF